MVGHEVLCSLPSCSQNLLGLILLLHYCWSHHWNLEWRSLKSHSQQLVQMAAGTIVASPPCRWERFPPNCSSPDRVAASVPQAPIFCQHPPTDPHWLEHPPGWAIKLSTSSSHFVHPLVAPNMDAIATHALPLVQQNWSYNLACPYLGPPDKEEDRRAACGSTPSTYNGGKCVENACSSVTRVQWHCTGVVCNNTIVLMQSGSSMQREISLNACGEVQGQGFGWNNRGGAIQTIITHPIQATTVNKGWRLAVSSQPSLDHISNFESKHPSAWACGKHGVCLYWSQWVNKLGFLYL